MTEFRSSVGQLDPRRMGRTVGAVDMVFPHRDTCSLALWVDAHKRDIPALTTTISISPTSLLAFSTTSSTTLLSSPGHR